MNIPKNLKQKCIEKDEMSGRNQVNDYKINLEMVEPLADEIADFIFKKFKTKPTPKEIGIIIGALEFIKNDLIESMKYEGHEYIIREKPQELS